MSDKMMRRTLIVCAGVLVLCGLPMVVMAVVQRDVRMGLYGVMSLLFALSDVLQLFLVGGCWAAPSGHDVRFEDAAGRWVYEGQLRADTVRHGVISERKLARLNPDRPVSFRADQAVSRFGTTLGRCPLGLRSSVTHRHF